ncbi:hypothetical protein BH11MYX1_BH11MYX1_42230 [soil metagenome]
MTPCTVLVVDDDDDIRETVADALTQYGHVVLQAKEGADALRVLRETESLPGLILLDLMMPGMDGITFRHHQTQDTRLRGIPVVVLSADAHAEARTSAMGVAACYRKPVKLAALYELVDRYC